MNSMESDYERPLTAPRSALAYQVILCDKSWQEAATQLRSSSKRLGAFILVVGLVALIAWMIVLISILTGPVSRLFERTVVMLILFPNIGLSITLGFFINALGNSVAAIVEASTINAKAAVGVST
jgi:uncharacterized membrane protein YkgB